MDVREKMLWGVRRAGVRIARGNQQEGDEGMPKMRPSDIEISRRLADYPPEFLYHLALITKEECERIASRERRTTARDRYRRAVLPST